MIQLLNDIDTQLFLYLNSLNTNILNLVMYWLSNKLIWLPMYLFIIYIVIKNYKKEGVFIIIFTIIVIVICDQVSSGLIKPLVLRLRPSHEPTIMNNIYITKAGPGGLYGFVSSHAANTFGMATFLGLILNNQFKILKYWLIIWSILVSYSRIYNGVHYPGDIVGGMIIGVSSGFLVFLLYKYLKLKFAKIYK